MNTTEPEHVTYSHISGVKVHILRTDAFNIKADAAIIGKSKRTLQKIEEMAGGVFKPYRKTRYAERQVKILRAEDFIWSNILSINYNPSNANIDSMHLFNLVNDILFVINTIRTESRPKTILILPLSWRNIDFICKAVVLSVWLSAHSIASTLQKNPSDIQFNRSFDWLFARLLKDHPEIAEEVKKDQEQEKERLEKLERRIVIPEFYLVNDENTGPFINAIENRNNCLENTLADWISYLKKTPFTRVEDKT